MEAHKENTAIVITANVNMDTGPQAMDTATDWGEEEIIWLV
mgnify:CR=1 FL=1